MSERTWVAEADLPSPRIQLRWRPAKDTEYKRFGQCTWMCRYELVLPLEPFDIRADSEDDDRLRFGCWVSAISETARGTDNSRPCYNRDGSRYPDTPFRDGVHARIDAKLIGDLPVYVVTDDGWAIECEPLLTRTHSPDKAVRDE